MNLPHRCYLLEIPPELRASIYEFFFANLQSSLETMPPLLRVNKELYHEAISFHYAWTRFHFSIENVDQTFRMYAKLANRYKSSIKHLYCDDARCRFNAKGAAAMIRRTQKAAEMMSAEVPEDFIQGVIRAPIQANNAEDAICTIDPEGLATAKGWT